ncbi:MAG TPA: HAD family hydrolase [Acidimicrobiales bacterium]|nr:HAD family hydrolase [Acidimicrobiales bacterium]
MIASDLDGTLLRSDGSISDRTREALADAEDAGMVVVLATGRPPRWMHGIAEATGHRGLAVCSNGAIVYDLHTEEIVEEHMIDVEVAAMLVERLRLELPGLAFAVERRHGFHHEPGYTRMWEGDFASDTTIADAAELVDLPMCKLLARHDSMTPEDFLATAAAVIGDLATVTYSGTDGLLEISSAGVTKAFTLERFAVEHGVDAAGVVAFGDMPNDLPMLSWAGHGVAVRDAHPEVLAVADEVTASNDDDGVAIVVERVVAGA